MQKHPNHLTHGEYKATRIEGHNDNVSRETFATLFHRGIGVTVRARGGLIPVSVPIVMLMSMLIRVARADTDTGSGYFRRGAYS